jgi:hypothetical protein
VLRNKLENKGQKCIFVEYSEDTKGYKMYDPVARKFIIGHNVQFMENEAWNGRITKTVKIIDAMENTKDEMVQTPCIGRCIVLYTPGTMTQITVKNTPIRIAGAQFTPRAQQTSTSSPSSSTSPYPNLANMLPRKRRNMCDIYNKDASNSFSVFFLCFRK